MTEPGILLKPVNVDNHYDHLIDRKRNKLEKAV